MPLLLDQRQETFCQEVAKGTSVAESYRIAGYAPSKGNAYGLRIRKRIAARIDELVAARSAAVEVAALSAAEKAGVDAYWVMRTLRRNAVMAARAGDRAASNRAAELIGKHIGMFVDKKSIEISYIDDADEYLAKILEIVNGKVIDAEPLALPAAEGGSECGSAETEQQDPIDIIDESS
jgi:hypothetical protein